jgi:hypothetical protein
MARGSHRAARRFRQPIGAGRPYLGDLLPAHESVLAASSRRPWATAVRGVSGQPTQKAAITNRRHGWPLPSNAPNRKKPGANGSTSAQRSNDRIPAG